MASYMAVPSMLSVAPTGRTNLATVESILRFSVMQRKLIGKVAVDELVEKAVIRADFMARKNLTGEIRVISHKISGKVIRP